jgi:hypothetical protein
MKTSILFVLSFLIFLCVGTASSIGVYSEDEAFPGESTVKGLKEVGVLDFGNEENGVTLYENKLPKIKEITVTQAYYDARSSFSKNNKNEADPIFEDACGDFSKRKPAVPSAQDMKTFFEKAYEITGYELTQQMIWVPCRAEGTISFVDGTSGHWSVNLNGVGGLNLKDGRGGYFYCPDCKGKVFDLMDMDTDAKFTFHKK